MNQAKLIFIYTVICVFIGVSAVGILAAAGVIRLPDTATAAALIGPCLGIVATVIGAKHIFDDPEAVKKIKEEQLDSELRMKRQNAETIASLKETHRKELKKKDAELEEKDTEIESLQSEIKKLRTKPMGNPADLPYDRSTS